MVWVLGNEAFLALPPAGAVGVSPFVLCSLSGSNNVCDIILQSQTPAGLDSGRPSSKGSERRKGREAITKATLLNISRLLSLSALLTLCFPKHAPGKSWRSNCDLHSSLMSTGSEARLSKQPGELIR